MDQIQYAAIRIAHAIEHSAELVESGKKTTNDHFDLTARLWKEAELFGVTVEVDARIYKMQADKWGPDQADAIRTEAQKIVDTARMRLN